MDQALASASRLDNVLLMTDEDEYDRIAYEVVTSFKNTDVVANLPIANLDPSFHTIPFFCVLSTQIDLWVAATGSNSRLLPPTLLPEGQEWPLISNALLQFDPIAVRYVGKAFTKVVDIVTRGAIQTSNYVPALQLLQHAILRLDPLSSTLTSTHYHYVRLCLLARAYSEATVILNYPIHSIPSSEGIKQLGSRAFKNLCSSHDSSVTYLNSHTGLSENMTSRMYLEYFLMAAMCCLALGEFLQAKFFLELVLTTPTQQNIVSLIMIDAYKKWLLVGLVINGMGTELPKAISVNTVKHIRALAKPYECLVDAYKSRKSETLWAEVQEGNEVWQQDGNSGLVAELCSSFRKHTVLRLGKTYAALSVEDMARRFSTTPDNLETNFSFIRSMIDSGDLNAELVTPPNAATEILRFFPHSSAQKTETEIDQELALRTRELQLLVSQISNYDHQLEINQDYIDYLQKLKKARDQQKKNAKPGTSLIPGPDIADEDMMDDF